MERRQDDPTELDQQRIADQLIAAEQEERRRIALFLHDGPVQSLAGISLMLDAAVAQVENGDHDALPIMRAALDRTRDTIRALRDLSYRTRCRAFVLTVPYVPQTRVGLFHIRAGRSEPAHPETASASAPTWMDAGSLMRVMWRNDRAHSRGASDVQNVTEASSPLPQNEMNPSPTVRA